MKLKYKQKLKNFLELIHKIRLFKHWLYLLFVDASKDILSLAHTM